MFVRKKQNKSGSISIQILKKEGGKNHLVQTIGSSKDAAKIEYLCQKGYSAISEINGQMEFELLSQTEKEVVQFLKKNDTLRIRVVGPEIIVGRIYDEIGFSEIGEELFRHLVITRIVFPGSKLRTIDYLQRYNGIELLTSAKKREGWEIVRK